MSPCWKISRRALTFDLGNYFSDVKHWDFKTISFSCAPNKMIVVRCENVFLLMPVDRHVSLAHPFLTNMRLHLEVKPVDKLQALRIYKSA